MKKTMFGVTVSCLLLSATIFLGSAQAAEDTDALTGTWTGTETYTCCGDYPFSWTFTPLIGNIILNLDATRTSTGSTVEGKAISLGPKGLAKHPAYGGTAGCKYVFKGSVSGDTYTGTATYKCNDGYVADGTFTATRTSVIDSPPMLEGGSPDPR